MTIMDNMRDWFTSESARNKHSSILSGLLFFTGWWIFIDALASYPGKISAGQIIVGVVAAISFFMVNSVKNSHLSEDNVSVSRARAAKFWFFIGFMLGFSSIIASVWMMVAEFTGKESPETWPAVAILLQNVLIFIANLLYRFGRNEEDWSY